MITILMVSFFMLVSASIEILFEHRNAPKPRSIRIFDCFFLIISLGITIIALCLDTKLWAGFSLVGVTLSWCLAMLRKFTDDDGFITLQAFGFGVLGWTQLVKSTSLGVALLIIFLAHLAYIAFRCQKSATKIRTHGRKISGGNAPSSHGN